MKLSNVTLLGIDCVNVERLQAAMDLCQKDFQFGAVKLLTSLPTDDKRLVKIHHIGDVQEYSRFCAEDLVKYVDTDYVLIVQYDGFILNPDSWTDEFLKYDYIGAPWLVADWSVRDYNFPPSLLGTAVVGNGGFSLRSKKFLEVSAKLMKEGKISQIHPEDVSLCIWHKDLLDAEGIRIATPELAGKFAIEGDDDVYNKQFGFHGFSWTDIDKWINDHPENHLIVSGYMKARTSHFHRILIRAREQTLNKAVNLFQDKAVEAHVFGSVARRDSDPYSDLDIWFTFKDRDIKDVLEKRFEYYSQVGEIVHVCEPPQNAPTNGIHSFVLYKTFAGLLQVDYYLCPQSTSFVTKDSRKVFGEIDLFVGELGFNKQKVQLDSNYRVDFVIFILFIAIKNLARNKTDALDNLLIEYAYLYDRYSIQVDQLVNDEHTFENLKNISTNLMKVAKEKQKKALLEIQAFADKVKAYSTDVELS